MPSIIATTTALDLETALIERIAAIVPRHVVQRSLGWRPSPENRPYGESSEVPRMFWVELLPGPAVEGGLTGNGDSEVSLGVDVIADYRAFVDTEVGDVVEQDKWDLFDDWTNAINVIPGLTHVEDPEEPGADGDEEAARIRFPLTIFYMRERR